MIKEFLAKFKLGFLFLQFGDGFVSKAFLMTLPFLPFLKKKLGLMDKKTKLMMRFNGRKFSFCFFGIYEEIVMIKEIFLNQCYMASGVPKAIVDFGANIGVSAVFFASLYPEARVWAVEPDPRNFVRLQENTQDFKNIEIINCAIGERSGYADFYVNQSKIISSSLLRRSPDDHVVQIKVMSVDDFFAKFGLESVDILKFDIEGAEYEAFKKFNFKRAKTVLAELHLDLAGDKTPQDFVELLGDDFIVDLKTLGSKNRFFLKASQRHEQKN